MSKISPRLWSEREAEEAANFHVSLLPESRIDHVQRNGSDSPGGAQRVMAAMLGMVKLDIAALKAAHAGIPPA
ncbi:VOC family protein [Xanthobacter sp. VNH20]|uniref:VOC family protein n=1 Tax=Xanthobacter sp. VNH20 TaxID=3156616 RepID=UPI0032B4AE65